MKTFILTTHGSMAEGMVHSAKMLGADTDKLLVVPFLEGMGAEELQDELGNLVENASEDNQFLFLCDLKGGTPFNVAGRLSFKNDNISVFYGVNLPILLTVLLSNEQMSLSDLCDDLKNVLMESLGIAEF